MRIALNIRHTPSIHFASFVLISIIIFFVVKTILVWLESQTALFGNIAEIMLWTALVGLGVATFKIRMCDLPPMMSIILSYIFILFAIYMFFPVTLPLETGLAEASRFRLILGHFMFSGLCALGLWRPGVGIIGLVGALLERLSLGHLIQQTLSKTEWFPLVEVALFMVVSAALVPLLLRFKYFNLADSPMSPGDRLSIYEKLTLLAIAVHFSNYFYSGVKKIFLGEHPLSWVIHNETWSLMLTSSVLGHLPLSFDQILTSIGIASFQKFVVIGNASIFFGQLVAIVAGVSIRWIIFACLFYDLTHILIFLTTGIFFYKWIILNFAIVAALVSVRNKIVPNPLKVMIVAMIVAAPLPFFVAKLGWWDTRSLNHEQFYAILNDGTEVRVPTNYWGSYAVTYAQLRRIRDKGDEFFPTGTSGITFGQNNMRMGIDCSFVLPSSSDSLDVVSMVFRNPDNKVAYHVKLHHEYVLDNIDEDGKIAYDFYPHHIWSMPWLFKAFSELDKSKIVAYRYVIEAKCLRYENDRVIEDVKRRSSHIIHVK